MNINKKEDDLKNIINEKDNIIKKINEKLLEQAIRLDNTEKWNKLLEERILNQEIKIQNQENDIRQLNIKIEELNKQNETKFKEK